ncbi:uncharacterized protein PRCAT00004637001 [Priceomyces carsonii]|uniref:uncharacterized protein n=1 Tax=Priceomyces carsonii TaxID=28549 RepID=UPI002ED81D1B|nr:unnamed protein product [Priceomyces carsonii]
MSDELSGRDSKSHLKESKKEKKERKKEKSRQKDRETNKGEKTPSHEPHKTHSDLEEISIDLEANVPLSKKDQRLLKKGKLDITKPTNLNSSAENEAGTKKSDFGVWIGNLSYDTTVEDLRRYFVAKTASYKLLDESELDLDLLKIEESDIVRINLPRKDKKIKGFAYMDFAGPRHVISAVSLSETQLGGRNLLIKDVHSFEGRPKKDPSKSLSKNPPSRILFVGNLSFDTTKDLLEEHFRHCGTIVNVRMATFEDSGKCKGFAFIDFNDESGPTTALKSKLAKKLINRPLRLEYGEDRSKRTPSRKRILPDEDSTETTGRNDIEDDNKTPPNTREFPVKRGKPDKYHVNDNKRMKSSVALATAQRASAAILPSTGKKIKFD